LRKTSLYTDKCKRFLFICFIWSNRCRCACFIWSKKCKCFVYTLR